MVVASGRVMLMLVKSARKLGKVNYGLNLVCVGNLLATWNFGQSFILLLIDATEYECT